MPNREPEAGLEPAQCRRLDADHTPSKARPKTQGRRAPTCRGRPGTNQTARRGIGEAVFIGIPDAGLALI